MDEMRCPRCGALVRDGDHLQNHICLSVAKMPPGGDPDDWFDAIADDLRVHNDMVGRLLDAQGEPKSKSTHGGPA
jgi:hypothetical protein